MYTRMSVYMHICAYVCTYEHSSTQLFIRLKIQLTKWLPYVLLVSVCVCFFFLFAFGQQSNWKTNKKNISMAIYSHKKKKKQKGMWKQVARNEIEFMVDLFHWMEFEFALGTSELRKLLEKLPAYCFKVIITFGIVFIIE